MWRYRFLIMVCWAVGFLPPSLARGATVASAVVVAGLMAVKWRRSPADRRLPLLSASVASLALAGVWALAIVDQAQPLAVLVVDDFSVLCVAVLVVVATRGIWSRAAATTLVVELGPAEHRGQPVEDQLARFLADPALKLRYRSPGLSWFDEQGRSAPDPDAEELEVTRASAPAGGQVALVHGAGSSPDPGLAEAAAAAAALVLDSARLKAELHARSDELRASRRRLLTAGDAERRWLEERLNSEVLANLRQVEQLLANRPALDATVVALRNAMAEVSALGLGLYPPALARHDLGGAFVELARLCSVPVTVELTGELGPVPAPVREALWFVCSEALANVARHSGASEAEVHAVLNELTVSIEICDNGRGGATLNHGLRGLADRVEALGGTLAIDSPLGGPTAVRAELPT